MVVGVFLDVHDGEDSEDEFVDEIELCNHSPEETGDI